MSIQPLSLKHLSLPLNLIQGPLAGISCAPFRRLTWEHSQPAYSCTEMISCKPLLAKNKKSQRRFLQKDPHEGPVCFQLASEDPHELAEATKYVTDLGADIIDLNCGCPVRKIRAKGAGSALLTEPAKLFRLISAMKQNTHVPVSIKIRVEGKSSDRFNAEIAGVVEEAGADLLTVHGRHWNEHYETPCQHEQIQFFVDALKIPVIGNGDITCIDSLKKMFATGCAGVMIGRAGVGQPWLIKKLVTEMRGEVFTPPTLQEIHAAFLTHVIELAHLLDNEPLAIMQARKFARYYARTLPNRMAFVETVNTCETLKMLQAVCQTHF